MTTAYLSLGANIGDPEGQLVSALRRLASAPGTSLAAVSGLYRTAPQGLTDQPDFLNCAARIETALDPYGLLALTQSIEADLGRVRTIRWGPRTIDIDILLHGQARLDGPGLTLPHPRMLERAFVLAPLLEVWRDGEEPAGISRTALEGRLSDLGDQPVVRIRDRQSLLRQIQGVE
ncbi:2-amino-4-hydroxy-6-hydroxymethyldihydropteridine diphosphokinase [Symbiobacterium thermophilum]|uniref:2-amino-4-hydroxy-6-hydroxymethyldihydropteridine diphosphokinase n=2 Tax=Symbiobacterium thermophilum TaxID=2734 RepID=Q67JI2_SYMTH|nr:2-amino-4-hydroxy-6-hydroxymethyldihydropteridine diphosphokinase [Symbiobacterium thermophilum]OTA40300.1 MAG: 2-amino-4-hydroxy-6-hydroxymethyldihydropteridine pyrophosphokinase [Symbiobacterium thermophilum]BAD42168.1 2-amino-4-hydroxy-6-hydroxymethyldihydropteridine pyrophosphokinase [Symbiobacterium thermophilum IAM 14863]